MAGHAVYRAVVRAVKRKSLMEPFNAKEFRKACPGFADSTYGTFLGKHEENNPGGNSRLFKRVSRGVYKLLRPFKYGMN